MKDAWASVIGHGLRALIVLGAVNSLTIGMYYSRAGWTETVQQVTAIAYGAIATISVFCLTFVVFVLRTPPLLAAEEKVKRGPDSPLTFFFDPAHRTCVQRFMHSLSLVTMIRVGVLNSDRRRVEGVSVALHAIKPPLPRIEMTFEAGHENHTFPLADTRTMRFDVSPSPDGSPTVFVDVLLQATDEHQMFHGGRLLCCELAEPSGGRDLTSTRLSKSADDVEITLRLDGPLASPPLMLTLRRERTRGELLVVSPNPSGSPLPSSWAPSAPVA